MGCDVPQLNKPFQEAGLFRSKLNSYLKETVQHRSVSTADHLDGCGCTTDTPASTIVVPTVRMNPPRYFFGRRAGEQNVRFEISVALRSITTDPQDLRARIEQEFLSQYAANFVGYPTVTHRPSYGDIRIKGRLNSIPEPEARFSISASSVEGTVQLHFSFLPLYGITAWQVQNREEFRFALERTSVNGLDAWQLSLNPLSSREMRLLVSEDCFNELRDDFGTHLEHVFSIPQPLNGNAAFASYMLRPSEAELHWMMQSNETIFRQQHLVLRSNHVPAFAILPLENQLEGTTHLFLIRSNTPCKITLRLIPHGRGLSGLENRQFASTVQDENNGYLNQHMENYEGNPQVRFDHIEAKKTNVFGLRITGTCELQVRFEDRPIYFEPVEGIESEQVDISEVEIPDQDPGLLSAIAQEVLDLSTGLNLPADWEAPLEFSPSAVSLVADLLRHRYSDLLPGPPRNPSEGVGKSQLTRMANALDCLPGLPVPAANERSGPLERLMDGQFMWEYHAAGGDEKEEPDDDFSSFFSSVEERHTGIFRYSPEACGYLPFEGSSLALLIDHRSVTQLQRQFAELSSANVHMVSTGHRLIEVNHAETLCMPRLEDLPPLLRLPEHPVTLLNSCFASEQMLNPPNWEGWRTDWFDIEAEQPKVTIHAEGLRRTPHRGDGWMAERGRPLQAMSADKSEIHRFYLQRLVRLPNEELEEQDVPEFMRPFNTAYRLERTSWLNRVPQPTQHVVVFQPSLDSGFVPWPFQDRHAALPRSGSLLRFHRFDALRDVLRAFFAASGITQRLPHQGLHLLPFHLKALVNGHGNSSVYDAIAEVDAAAATALANHVRSKAWIPTSE